MISLKKYLETEEPVAEPTVKNSALAKVSAKELLPITVNAYRSALLEMGNCSSDACPALGQELQHEMTKLQDALAGSLSDETVRSTEATVKEKLRSWGRETAEHYRKKTGEVKEILLVMARTAESVGERDQRCAEQINDVTKRLKKIADLEDISVMRLSIEKSAADLKGSVDRMTAEGRAAIDQLKAQVSTYEARLEEAEEIASTDALTGLRSRLCIEGHLDRRIEAGAQFCVAILDIDLFKQVNDKHGHVVGDELLKQFAGELKSACRATDVIGRWGGDEFIILQDCRMKEAIAQSERLTKWVCGNYTLQGVHGPLALQVNASIGLAEFQPNETKKELISRADSEMYQYKKTAKASANSTSR